MPKRTYYRYYCGFYQHKESMLMIDAVWITSAQSNDLNALRNLAEEQNYELRQRLPEIRIGKRKISDRYKVLRKMTNQVEIFS